MRDSILICGMTLKQLEKVEAAFAVFTPEGWLVPPWVVRARRFFETGVW